MNETDYKSLDRVFSREIRHNYDSVFDGCGIMRSIVFVWLMCYEAGDTEKAPHRRTVILAVLCLLIGVLMPSKDTIYTMATLNYVTTDNIKAIGDTAGNVIDYVIDKIEEITDED